MTRIYSTVMKSREQSFAQSAVKWMTERFRILNSRFKLWTLR